MSQRNVIFDETKNFRCSLRTYFLIFILEIFVELTRKLISLIKTEKNILKMLKVTILVKFFDDALYEEVPVYESASAFGNLPEFRNLGLLF